MSTLQKVSKGAIESLLKISFEGSIDINYTLQILAINLCKTTSRTNNDVLFYTCTLCDDKYKYSGFIIGRNLSEREPKISDIISLKKITQKNINNGTKKIFIVKNYETIKENCDIIRGLQNANNLLQNLNNNSDINKKENINNNNNEIKLQQQKFEDEDMINKFIEENNDNSSQIENINETSLINNQNPQENQIQKKEDEEEEKFIPKNIIYLNDISTYSKNICIYIKIIKKCEVKPFFNKHTFKNGKLLSFDIMDSKGFEMQANIFDDTIDKYTNLLQVGEIYYIQGGYARISEKIYTNIKSDYKIIFDLNTKFTKIDKNRDTMFLQKSENISIIKFSDLKNYQKNSVVDCIAYVLEASKTTIKSSKNGTNIKIRRILLCDYSGIKISMTLWKKFCDLEIEKGNILLLKYIRVTEYNGICLTTIDDSNIIINPTIDLNEIDELKKYIQNGINQDELKFLNKLNSNEYNYSNLTYSPLNPNIDININNNNINEINNNSNNNNNNINEKLVTINELLFSLKPNSKYSPTFNIKATVYGINHSNKNYFTGCPNKACRKKLSKTNENEWFCQACKEKYTEPYYYYTVSLKIKDLTGEHFVDLFGDTVTTLFGIRADEYNIMIENNNIEKLNEINSQIEFQKFYFSGKASIQKYNNRIKKQFFVYRFEKINIKNESYQILENIKKIIDSD